MSWSPRVFGIAAILSFRSSTQAHPVQEPPSRDQTSVLEREARILNREALHSFQKGDYVATVTKYARLQEIIRPAHGQMLGRRFSDRR